jgi:hypothetical protein
VVSSCPRLRPDHALFHITEPPSTDTNGGALSPDGPLLGNLLISTLEYNSTRSTFHRASQGYSTLWHASMRQIVAPPRPHDSTHERAGKRVGVPKAHGVLPKRPRVALGGPAGMASGVRQFVAFTRLEASWYGVAQHGEGVTKNDLVPGRCGGLLGISRSVRMLPSVGGGPREPRRFDEGLR